MSERISEDMSKSISNDMSERMSKDMSKKRKKIVSSHSAKFKVTESISGDEWYVCPHLTRSSDTKSKKAS